LGLVFLFIIWGQLPWNYRGRRSHLPARHGKDGTDSATHIFRPALRDRVRIPRLLFPEINGFVLTKRNFAVLQWALQHRL